MSVRAVIECRGLTKVFKDFWMRPRVTAVDGLDLEVFEKEVFGLLGPNGSGKSTTIKMILGLLFPTKGRIGIFGRLPSDVKIKSRIGYLPEESYLYRFLNARETLEYYAKLFELDRRARNKRIDMLLDMVGLERVQRRPIGEYSKGMQRRIGLAQALINDPDLLILDEPTTGLDPIGTRQIKDLIVRLKERGKTVLLCSHLLADVEDVCDRVTILYGGKIRALGTVDELLAATDTMLLETDRLSPEQVEKVRAVLESDGHRALRKVESPRKRLETLFLEIVRAAQSEGAETYGARSADGVADFLRADGQTPPAVSAGPQAPKTAPVLKELETAAQPEHLAKSPHEAAAAAATPKVDKPIAPPVPQSAMPAEKPKGDVAVLASLMGEAVPEEDPAAPQESANEPVAPARAIIEELTQEKPAPKQAESTNRPGPPAPPGPEKSKTPPKADRSVIDDLLAGD